MAWVHSVLEDTGPRAPALPVGAGHCAFDTAMSARGEREHLLESYASMRSAGFDEHVYSDANDFEGLRWVRKREVDVRSLKLEYKGCRDVDQVLGRLVVDENDDMASYYALTKQGERCT